MEGGRLQNPGKTGGEGDKSGFTPYKKRGGGAGNVLACRRSVGGGGGGGGGEARKVSRYFWDSQKLKPCWRGGTINFHPFNGA